MPGPVCDLLDALSRRHVVLGWRKSVIKFIHVQSMLSVHDTGASFYFLQASLGHVSTLLSLLGCLRPEEIQHFAPALGGARCKVSARGFDSEQCAAQQLGTRDGAGMEGKLRLAIEDCRGICYGQVAKVWGRSTGCGSKEAGCHLIYNCLACFTPRSRPQAPTGTVTFPVPFGVERQMQRESDPMTRSVGK